MVLNIDLEWIEKTIYRTLINGALGFSSTEYSQINYLKFNKCEFCGVSSEFIKLDLF